MPEAKNSSVPPAGRGRPTEDEADTAPPEAPRRRRSSKPPPLGAPEPPKDEMGGFLKPGVINVKLVYALYLVAIAMPPVALFGALLAYLAQRKSPSAWLMTHYLYQMRTFVIGFGANIIAYGLSFIGIGLLLFPLIAVWVVARAVHGLTRVARREPIDDPNSLLI